MLIEMMMMMIRMLRVKMKTIMKLGMFTADGDVSDDGAMVEEVEEEVE